MPQKKTLLEIRQITDDDTGMYSIGEVDFGYRESDLEDFIKRNGYQGLVNIQDTVCHLLFELRGMYYDLHEKGLTPEAKEASKDQNQKSPRKD
jgi:hypothetical protein